MRLPLPLVVLALSSCTLTKPIVGAVVGPVRILAEVFSDGTPACGCGTGEEWCLVLMGGSVLGAGAGLVTGIISDYHWMRGDVVEPMANWHDPFATNRNSNTCTVSDHDP